MRIFKHEIHIDMYLKELYREFGVLGSVTVVGGIVLLLGLNDTAVPFEQVTIRAVSGLLLFLLATYITYFRGRARVETDRAAIEMTRDICNRIAEQLGKDMQSTNIPGMTQKIRQLQRDMVSFVSNPNRTEGIERLLNTADDSDDN